MRFIALLSLVCIGLVCSSPVDRESDRDVEYVDAADSRQEPEVRDTDDSFGAYPQGRVPVVILDTPAFRPYDADDDDDVFGADDDSYNYQPRPLFPNNDFFYRSWRQQQMDTMRRLNELFRRWFSFSHRFQPPRFPPGFFDVNDFGNFSNLPPNYDNSTYTTKNINGTIVSVNETIRKVENNDSSFVFHVKTVQVVPPNETAGSDDGLTVVGGEEVDVVGEGGQGSTSGTTADEGGQGSTSGTTAGEGGQGSTSGTTVGAVETSSEPSSQGSTEITESSDNVNAGPSSTSEDPSANDVNLARRFRRYALPQ